MGFTTFFMISNYSSIFSTYNNIVTFFTHDLYSDDDTRLQCIHVWSLLLLSISMGTTAYLDRALHIHGLPPFLPGVEHLQHFSYIFSLASAFTGVSLSAYLPFSHSHSHQTTLLQALIRSIPSDTLLLGIQRHLSLLTLFSNKHIYFDTRSLSHGLFSLVQLSQP